MNFSRVGMGCQGLNVEIALNGRVLMKTEVFEKRVFEQTVPFKLTK